MSEPYPLVDQQFVDDFNVALTALGSPASIAVTTLPTDGTVFELRDGEGDFLILVPSNATPEIISLACRLYEMGRQYPMSPARSAIGAWRSSTIMSSMTASIMATGRCS